MTVFCREELLHQMRLADSSIDVRCSNGNKWKLYCWGRKTRFDYFRGFGVPLTPTYPQCEVMMKVKHYQFKCAIKKVEILTCPVW